MLTALLSRSLGLKGRPGGGQGGPGAQRRPFPAPPAPPPASGPALTGLVSEGGTEAGGLLGHPLLQRLLAQAEIAHGGQGEAALLAPRVPVAREDEPWGWDVGAARGRPGSPRPAPAFPAPSPFSPRVLHPAKSRPPGDRCHPLSPTVLASSPGLGAGLGPTLPAMTPSSFSPSPSPPPTCCPGPPSPPPPRTPAGSAPPPPALGARPEAQVLVDGLGRPVGRVLAALHQHLAHGRRAADHDHGRPGQLQAEHVPEAAPQLRAGGAGRVRVRPGPRVKAPAAGTPRRRRPPRWGTDVTRPGGPIASPVRGDLPADQTPRRLQRSPNCPGATGASREAAGPQQHRAGTRALRLSTSTS